MSSISLACSLDIIACGFPIAIVLGRNIGRLIIIIKRNLICKLEFWNLRLRYIREKVKRTLKRIVNPKRTAVPIQYQFLSGKILKLFSTATPKLVSLSEAWIGPNISH